MLTDNRADHRTQDWFLIACDGDLVLKLAQDLMIGEDERGQTVLSPAREDALLRITSEHGCLTLQAMAMDWTFSEDGGLSRQHLTFVEGLTLRLNFPSSSLILTPDFQTGARARADREIHLMPTTTPTLTLSRVDEPVTLIEPALLPAPELPVSEIVESTAGAAEALAADELLIEQAAEQARVAATFSQWDHQIPDEEPEELEEPQAPMPALVPATVATAAESAAQPPATTAVFEELPAAEVQLPVVRRTHGPLSGLIAAAALLAPMCLFLADASKLGIDFPLSNYRPLNETAQVTGSVERSPLQQQTMEESVAVASAPPVESAVESTVAAAAPAPVPAEQPVPAVDDEAQLLIDSLLAEAKAFYDAGLIVTPVQANAVSNLTQVLSIDPRNEEGLRLMYLSAVTLIEEAEAAHAAGDNYLARNLVEDVLGFHPEFDDARALLDSWTRVPEG